MLYWYIRCMLICYVYVDMVCMCGWVETDLLCVEGQQTQGIPDRLKASGAYQLGRRPREQSI